MIIYLGLLAKCKLDSLPQTHRFKGWVITSEGS